MTDSPDNVHFIVDFDEAGRNPAARTGLELDIRTRAEADAEFRARLIADPKAALQDAYGFELPDAMSIQVREESANEVVLVLPPSEVLSDDDLEAVAGGRTSMILGRSPVVTSTRALGEEDGAAGWQPSTGQLTATAPTGPIANPPRPVSPKK